MKFKHLPHLELEVVQNQPKPKPTFLCPFTPIIPYNGYSLVDWQQNLKDPISTPSENILFFVFPHMFPMCSQCVPKDIPNSTSFF